MSRFPSLLIMPSGNSPKVSYPSTGDQKQECDKQGHTNSLIPQTLWPSGERFLPLVDEIAFGYSLFPSPLQMPNIWVDEAASYKHSCDNDGTGGKNHIDNDHIVVGVVVAILNDTSDDPDDDVHAVVYSNLDRVPRTEHFLVPHGCADGIDDDGRTEHGCDAKDSK